MGLISPPHSNGRAFTFAQITDLHIGAGQSESDLKAVLAALLSLPESVDFAVVTGDLSEMREIDEFVRCRTLLDSSGIACYVLLGNHDVRWSSLCGDEIARIFPGAPHFSFVHEGVHFIGLNSALPLEAWGDLSPAEQNWLARQLGKFPPGKAPSS